MQPDMQEKREYRKDFAPRHNNRILDILMMLFVLGLLVAMYFVFPKAASQSANHAVYQGLVISEVMAANASAVPDEEGAFHDWVELYNGTGADINLQGVTLSNRQDRITFPFPSYVLKAGEYVVVFASGRYQLDVSKPFHGKFKIASLGDHIYLYDPDMRLIDKVSTPTMAADSSYALTPNNAGQIREYEITEQCSPGFENSEAGFIAYRKTNAAQGNALVINEVCPNPKVGIPDDDNEMVDWLELHNTTGEPFSLKGHYLSDRENKPMKWQFPDSAVVPAHGYYLVFCSGKDRLQQNGIPHTGFSISAKQETLVLSDAQGRLLDRITVENVPVDGSLGRGESGVWQQFRTATPGFANNQEGQNKADALMRAYNPSGVIISEVMASNATVLLGSSATTCDYVELYNTTDHEVDLSGYGLSDNINRPRQWQFPQGAVIGAGEYKVIYLDGRPEMSTYYEIRTSFKLARAGGETITFCDPEGRVLDRLPLSTIPTDHSYGRTLGAAGFYYYDTPTPGAANDAGYYGYTDNPRFSSRGGEYQNAVQVSIAVPDKATVYYTLDGAVPTESATRYAPGDVLSIGQVTVLRARAFDNAGTLQPSEIITQTYLPSVYHAFPIVSLVADPYELWNPQDGMLTVGPDVDKSGGIPFKNVVYRTAGQIPRLGIASLIGIDKALGKIPRPGYVEMYDKQGNQILSQGMEFSLQGQNSLDFAQKSFKLKAKSKHGAKYFAATLFEDRPFTEYKGFVLRISGNDSAWTRLIDGFQGRLMDRFNTVADRPSTVIHQAWKPVSVYLNGVYWGHYNLRERVDRYFVAQHEGLPLSEADQMDILEAGGKVFFGANKEYKAMIDKVKTLSPGDNEQDLQYIQDRIDVDNYFDYMAFEMFFGNSDVGNIRFYKLKGEEHKWKWIIYDLDYGFFKSGFNSPYSYLKEKGAGDQLIDNTLIRKLLENETMQDRFLTRLGEMYRLFTTDYMIQVFDEMAAEIEPEMALHFGRWAEENDKAISADSPTTPEGALRYWHTRLDFTRNVLRKRPTYFYEMVQERFELTDAQIEGYFGTKPSLPADAVYAEGVKWG